MARSALSDAAIVGIGRTPFVRKSGRTMEHGEVFTVDDLVAYVMSGLTDSPTDTAAARAWQAAGATWWLEALHPWGADPERMRDRVRAGPPRP